MDSMLCMQNLLEFLDVHAVKDQLAYLVYTAKFLLFMSFEFVLLLKLCHKRALINSLTTVLHLSENYFSALLEFMRFALFVSLKVLATYLAN